MSVFDLIAAGIVILSLIYISFVLTVANWLAALRKGQAVTLLPERGGRKWPLWTQIVMMVLGLALCVPLFYYGWIPLFTMSTSMARILDIIGLVIYLSGLGFTLWARRTLGKYWGLSTSQAVKLLDDHQLVQSGPYAFVRHPMYFGWWASMLGLTMLYPVWAIFLLFLFSLISFSNRARREEAAQAQRFGEAWVEYKRRTRFILSNVPGRLESLGAVSLLGINGKTWDTRVTHIRPAGQGYILALEGLTSPEEAGLWRGGLIQIPKGSAPPLPQGQYYECDLIGLRVQDEQGNGIGTLTDIWELSGNHVFVVQDGSKETLIPAARDLVVAVDLQQRVMTVHMIEGLGA